MFASLSERIAWTIETIKEDKDLDKGITDIDLAKKLGTNKDTLAAYRQRKGLLKGEVIENLVHRYGFNPMWLFRGQGEPFSGACDKYPDICGPASGIAVVGEPDIQPDEFVFIKHMRGKISAGTGLDPDNISDYHCAFRKDWLRKKGVSPDNLSLIKVQGDSMEPTLLSGDLVLVDHSRTVVAPQGGIYAIATDHEIMIKRIQVLFPQNKLKIISDNPRYEPIEADPGQIRINGRAIWYGREIER